MLGFVTMCFYVSGFVPGGPWQTGEDNDLMHENQLHCGHGALWFSGESMNPDGQLNNSSSHRLRVRLVSSR